MKIGAIVICRYNSSRLPGKILKKINNKALLTYIIERLKCVQNLDEITVATSEEATDQRVGYTESHRAVGRRYNAIEISEFSLVGCLTTSQLKIYL